ncbi:hypothetical protein EDB85DRAFT_2154617 [Lactarius pseudohatsudake]|nr:hypothetical protein EDB85DRAFT_2154617 [Lactarius pseudohatsudake]
MGVTGRLFKIVCLHRGGFQLAVNFDPQIITLFKDVRNLLWLGFQLDGELETVRTYGQTLDLVEHNKGIKWLVAEYQNDEGSV